MVRATDESENIQFRGILTILESNNVQQGDGSIEVSGSIYSDIIRSNTVGDYIDINNILIKDSRIVITDQVQSIETPPVGKYIFYVVFLHKWKIIVVLVFFAV